VERAILLGLAYVGTTFHGFAPQPGARTVAGELLGAVRALDPTVSALRAVSRTDAGVHARGQLVAFDVGRDIPARGWVLGVASHLPSTIAPRRAVFVPAGFDPRGHVRGKWYRYTILRDTCRDPFLEPFAWRCGGALDVDLAAHEAGTAVGTHDFAAFRSSADERTNTVRTITALRVARAQHDPRLVHIDVRGDGFLHKMVRIIAGALVDVARGRLAPGAIRLALDTRRRGVLGITAPPQGLCLQAVELDYPLDQGTAWPAACLDDVERANQS
jgi:tRNA pseudouridine38-40 synthase